MHLSAVYEAGFDLRDILLPAMKELSEETGEAVSFHVRERDHRVCLYRIASRHSIRAEVQQGDTQPLERGAGGRVLLAFAGEPGEPYETVALPLCLSVDGRTRPRNVGHLGPGVPPRRELVGALGIVGPSARMGMEEMERYRPRLLEFAARVTKALGGDPEPLLERRGRATHPPLLHPIIWTTGIPAPRLQKPRRADAQIQSYRILFRTT